MKKIVFSIIIFGSIIMACSREDLTVQIVRNPLLTFELDSSTWKADSYIITGPANVVVYPSNPALPGVIYKRYLLQATGKESKGSTIQFNLSFDAVDNEKLTGIYKVQYTTERGLQQGQLFTLGNTLSAYSICPNDTITPVFQIQKQSIDERLITATFQMTLCNTRDTTQKIKIINGILTDLKY